MHRVIDNETLQTRNLTRYLEIIELKNSTNFPSRLPEQLVKGEFFVFGDKSKTNSSIRGLVFNRVIGIDKSHLITTAQIVREAPRM